MREGNDDVTTRPIAYLAVAIYAIATSPAHAYLDPGTGSMILQGLIGGIAASVAVISIYFQKIKAFFRKVGGGAETAKKPSENE